MGCSLFWNKGGDQKVIMKLFCLNGIMIIYNNMEIIIYSKWLQSLPEIIKHTEPLLKRLNFHNFLFYLLVFFQCFY